MKQQDLKDLNMCCSSKLSMQRLTCSTSTYSFKVKKGVYCLGLGVIILCVHFTSVLGSPLSDDDSQCCKLMRPFSRYQKTMVCLLTSAYGYSELKSAQVNKTNIPNTLNLLR